MKIVELKISVVTTETRYTTIIDHDAINSNEDGEVQFSYEAKLSRPKIRPYVRIQTEPGDEKLITGGVYRFPDTGVSFVAIDNATLKQTEDWLCLPEEFVINIEVNPILIAHSFKER